MIGLTDRDRCLQLEARVAELEEEVEAWRAQARGEAREAAYATRIQALKHEFRRVGVGGQLGMGAKVLLDLMAHAGTVRTYRQLAATFATDPEDPCDKGAMVALIPVRKAMRAWRLDHHLSNVWGVGYLLSRAGAVAVEQMMRTEAA